MVGYLQIQGFAEIRYRDQRLFKEILKGKIEIFEVDFPNHNFKEFFISISRIKESEMLYVT